MQQFIYLSKEANALNASLTSAKTKNHRRLSHKYRLYIKTYKHPLKHHNIPKCLTKLRESQYDSHLHFCVPHSWTVPLSTWKEWKSTFFCRRVSPFQFGQGCKNHWEALETTGKHWEACIFSGSLISFSNLNSWTPACFFKEKPRAIIAQVPLDSLLAGGLT